MNHPLQDDFASLFATLAPSIAKLSASSAFIDFSKWNYGEKEDASALRTQDFIDKAKELGVPPRFWFMTVERSFRDSSVLGSFLLRNNVQKTIKLLVDNGASMWPQGRRQDKGSPATASFAKPKDVADLIFPRDSGSMALGSRRAAAAASSIGLADLPQGAAAEFISALISNYTDSTSRSSATSLGVMGAGDKAAKASAALAIEFAPLFAAACARYAPDLSERLDAMLADAKARLAAKTSKGSEAFDPEKLKKSLTPAQKTRMSTLSHLAESCADDGEAMRVLLDATPWLAEHPQALCLNFRSRVSLASMALSCAREETLEAIDRLGSNIWLAAAQGGEGNACLWAADLLSRRSYRATDSEKARAKSMAATAARLLAYGAFLDGAADPIAHAVAKTDEAIATAKSRKWNSDNTVALLVELRGRIEALALRELLEKRDALDGSTEGDGDGDGEGKKEEAPRRRSRSL